MPKESWPGYRARAEGGRERSEKAAMPKEERAELSKAQDCEDPSEPEHPLAGEQEPVRGRSTESAFSRRALRYCLALAAAVGVGVVLWLYVFPWAMTLLPANF